MDSNRLGRQTGSVEPARINVAIDGPAGAGKSTVAKLVASELEYIYVDTGAMYRAVALAALQSDVPADDHERISQLASELNIELKPGLHGQQLVLLNGEDVSELIRDPEVSRLVPQVAAIGAVRKVLVELQQKMARAKGVVMDGRDIGTHVIPDAEVKIFLTASAEERAKRRYEELTGKGVQVTYEQLVSDINERDRIDRERDISPLVQAADAVFIDSTGLTVQQVVNTIVNICRRALHKGESYG